MQLGFDIVPIGSVSVFLWLHGRETASEEEWDAACQRLRPLGIDRATDLSCFCALALSDGGGMTARQRVQLFHEVYGDQPVRTSAMSIVLSNPNVRRVATAAAWLNPALRGFEVREWRQALSHIGVSVKDAPLLIEGFTRIERDVGIVTTLRALALEIGQAK